MQPCTVSSCECASNLCLNCTKMTSTELFHTLTGNGYIGLVFFILCHDMLHSIDLTLTPAHGFSLAILCNQLAGCTA